MRFSLIFTITVFLQLNLFAGGGKEAKDTVQALVVSTQALQTANIQEMSGESIISMIDSLLDLDAVPTELIKEINHYAESKLLKHDFYVSLTGFYDSSIYPSNSMYQNWDTYNLYPYQESLRKDDKTINLVIADSTNYCGFVPPIKGLITSNFG